EYYVTCNPPLTPKGVASVVTALRDVVLDDIEYEILYEPDIPWFKLLSPPNTQIRITDKLRELLISVVEEDADLVDLDQQQYQIPVDVNVVTEDSRVMPWSVHEAGHQNLQYNSDLLFPDYLREHPQKRLWRGLETAGTDGWNIDVFFARLRLRWISFGNEAPAELLQRLLQCGLSWNARGTLLYIGSEESSPEALEKAIQKLDNLRDMASYGWRSQHLIVTEGSGPFRFCYKYMTHTGQYRSTYLLEMAPEDDDPLCKAVTVRAESQDEDGQWNQVGPSTTLKKAGMKPGSMKVFGPFKDYEYQRKEPSAVLDLFQSIVDANEAPQKAPQEEAPEEGPHDACQLGGLLGSSDVESWRINVQQAQSGETEELSQQASESQSLIDLDPVADPVGGSERESDLLRDVFGKPLSASCVQEETTQQVNSFLDSDDLICLNPTPQTPMATDAPKDMKSDLPKSLLDDDAPPLPIYVPPLPVGMSTRMQGRPASPTQAAPPHANGVSGRTTPKSHLLKMTEARVKELAEVLPLAPGLVSIDLRFGRFYRKNLGANRINTSHGRGHGPYWDDASSMVKVLGLVEEGDVGFSTALSACGPDLEEFVQMHPPDESPWQLLDTEAWYEIACTLNQDREAQMVVEVDAKTFEFRCRGIERELGSVYLHCVQRQWDAQVCISRRASLQNSPVHMAVAKALVASLATNTRDGRLYVETTDDARLQATVDSVSVRHVARYRQSKKSNSLLTVAMVRKLDKDERRENRRKWHTSPPRSPIRGTPIIWYEASVSSLPGREMFAENANMTLGGRASYTCDELEASGVFEDVCRPGFSMMSQMDDIGLLNDNGLRMEMVDSRRTMIAQDKTVKPEVYW
ncbi:hypothetical protein CP532_3536, partial [Ophiocordyceps camponoti-leonardi (nom. inval.)]